MTPESQVGWLLIVGGLAWLAWEWRRVRRQRAWETEIEDALRLAGGYGPAALYGPLVPDYVPSEWCDQ